MKELWNKISRIIHFVQRITSCANAIPVYPNTNDVHQIKPRKLYMQTFAASIWTWKEKFEKHTSSIGTNKRNPTQTSFRHAHIWISRTFSVHSWPVNPNFRVWALASRVALSETINHGRPEEWREVGIWVTSSQRAPCRRSRCPSVRRRLRRGGFTGNAEGSFEDVDAGLAGHFCGRKVHPIWKPT